jgi:uncharacterized membrane protein YphA (DoxX/SURF4 family)
MRTVGFSQALFAIAGASLAIFSLAYGDFAPGGASLPGWVPVSKAWTYAFALLVLVGSIGLFLPRWATSGALLVGGYLVVWSVLGTPSIISHPLSIGAWYGFCEALTVLVGAWILYVMLRASQEAGASGEQRGAVRLAQVLFGLCCIFYGCSHFTYATYTAAMVPAWLPARMGFAYFTGVCHIAAGVGIVLGILPRLAATLEAIMMSLFGLLVWVPSFFAEPRPSWAMPPKNQWSELVVNLVLAAAAWVVAASLRECAWIRRPVRST